MSTSLAWGAPSVEDKQKKAGMCRLLGRLFSNDKERLCLNVLAMHRTEHRVFWCRFFFESGRTVASLGLIVSSHVSASSDT